MVNQVNRLLYSGYSNTLVLSMKEYRLSQLKLTQHNENDIVNYSSKLIFNVSS